MIPEIRIGPKGREPDAAEKMEIRRVLRMRQKQPWNRCKYRSRKRAEELDRDLGFSEADIKANKGTHTKPNHTCSECRCAHTAGAGTRGWWYWDKTRGEVGHYGVGPCFYHSPYNTHWYTTSVDHPEYVDMIQKEIEAMQSVGSAPDHTGKWLVQVRDEGNRAMLRNELRTVVDEVRELADELKQDLDTGTLTEMAGGNSVPMSDKTKYELRLKLLKAISDLAKTELDSAQWEMFHKDQILIFLNSVLGYAEMVFQPKCSAEEWQDFGTELKNALQQMKPGRTKR